MHESTTNIDRRGQVMGLFRSLDAARACFEAAAAAGLTSEPIDLMVSDANHNHAFEEGPSFRTRSRGMKSKGAEVGGVIGAGVGASLAAAVSVGAALAVPGGAFALPLAATLAGGGAGMAAGGMIGGLAGYGVNRNDARRYDHDRAEGDVALCVRSRSPVEAHQLQRLMIEHRGEEVAIC